MKINQGFFILEALLSVVVLSLVLLSLFSMVSFLQLRTVRSTFVSDASLLLQEGMEIAHTAILASWTKYPDGEYSPAFNALAENWELVPGEETELQTRYTRKIELKKVCRNQDTGEQLDTGAAGCGGPLEDKNSRIIVTTIDWSDKGREESITGSLLVLKLPE